MCLLVRSLSISCAFVLFQRGTSGNDIPSASWAHYDCKDTLTSLFSNGGANGYLTRTPTNYVSSMSSSSTSQPIDDGLSLDKQTGRGNEFSLDKQTRTGGHEVDLNDWVVLGFVLNRLFLVAYIFCIVAAFVVLFMT